MRAKVLVVDDEFLIRMSLESGLSDLGYHVRTAQSIREGAELAETFRPDVVLLDNRLGQELGLDHIEDFKKVDEDIQIIMITAYGSVSQAVEAMKRGACHYIQKPFDLEEVDLIIRRNLDQLKRRRSLELMRQRPRQIVGESQAIQRICRNVDILAQNDNVDLLICGETGTGKGVVVNAIHDSSPRRDTPLVKINCGAIPETLLESELFGYEKGAFTGASKEGKMGVFESADKGTVFLDEVGDLPLEMQVHLLRVLQEMQVRRVGGVRSISVDVRIIAATNRNLLDMVHEKTFREDLYYRLNVVPIEIPPLRERKRDIRPLVESFLKDMNKKYRYQKRFADAAMEILYSYVWPGNVRELKNVVEQAVILSAGDEIQPSELPIACRFEGESHGGDETGRVNLKLEVARFEYEYICRAYEKYGTVRAAAASLGMDSATFVRKRRKFEELLQK